MQEYEKEFFTNPKIIENYSLLQEAGVFKHIDRLNAEIREYKSLLTAAAEIFSRTTIDEIMDTTVWQISDQFVPSFILFLWKPLQNREDITIKGYKNYKPADLTININSITPFEPFFLAHREPLSYKLLKRQVHDPIAAAAVEALGAVSPELVIPILGLSGLYGLIVVGEKMLTNSYSSQELSYLKQLMSFVSQAIQNHIHYQHSVRDVKTGLFNHGFFTTRLNEEIAHSRRRGIASSIIVIDVDRFKNFNDAFGHLAGDRVLEHIALAIKSNLRAGDVPSRFGGEEFTILLPNTDQETALVVAERLRTAIATMQVPWDVPLPQVTISLGVATFEKEKDVPTDEIIGRADEALYQSKENGRNRTTVWQPGLLVKSQHLLQS